MKANVALSVCVYDVLIEDGDVRVAVDYAAHIVHVNAALNVEQNAAPATLVNDAGFALTNAGSVHVDSARFFVDESENVTDNAPVVPVGTLRFGVNAHSMENTMRVALAVHAHNTENTARFMTKDVHSEENTAHVKCDNDSCFVPVGAARFADERVNAVRVDTVRFVMNDPHILMENEACFVQVNDEHFVDDNGALLEHVNQSLTV